MMRKKSGQTLIEILLAVAIIVILLVVMVGVVSKAIANSQYSRNRSLAARLVEEGLEQARSWRDQAADWETFRTSYNQTDDATLLPAPSPFRRAFTFSEETDVTTKKKVVIVVTWTDSQGPHTINGETYLTKWQ